MRASYEARVNRPANRGTQCRRKEARTGPCWTLAALMVVAGTGFCQTFSPAAGQERFYIGTYTEASSVGIYQSGLDLGTRALGRTNLVGTTQDPSFLALHPKGTYLYAVNEGGNAVVAFSVDRATGQLTLLNQQPSGGAGPCHVVVDNAGKNVLVANYTGGSLSVFPIQADGQLGSATAHIQHPGSSPHVHCIALDAGNQFALVCDLGLDQIFSYHFNSEQGTLTTNSVPWTTVPTGAGPRHLVFDPSFRRAYVICELNSTIISFDYDSQNGVLNAFQTNSSLPASWSGQNTAAEIAVDPSGRFLYGSNRGYNSIAVFGLDPVTGMISPVQQQPVGKTPRHFAIEPAGAFCLVANEDSDTIQEYAIDPRNGMLTPTGQTLNVSEPVCVLPILIQPPQPVLVLQSTPTNCMEIDIRNALSLLTYQIDRAPSVQPGVTWSLLATGTRGQTDFILTNANPCEFFRASVLIND